MFIDETTLQNLAPINTEKLDRLLENGYYRTRQFMFTTDAIFYETDYYPVFWLRTRVSDVVLNRTAKKINKLNSRFSYAVKPGNVTSEQEDLFKLYKTHIAFEHSNSVYENLYGEHEKSIFETSVIEVRDEGKLIACGFFDNGKESIMGLINFYHPDYKKFSPGKNLMLQKLNLATQWGKKYYYTGYIALGLNHFDYKTFPDDMAVDVFMWDTQTWELFGDKGKQMLEKKYLEQMEEYLKAYNTEVNNQQKLNESEN
ncbi:MAG: arginyl-tRNA--protein transferase [Bacteroidia bacterium]|jgi:arginine-tRNA-protein transferase|nr:arginyl-tRNA--protein transferase [Bacteroidia bacterium]